MSQSKGIVERMTQMREHKVHQRTSVCLSLRTHTLRRKATKEYLAQATVFSLIATVVREAEDWIGWLEFVSFQLWSFMRSRV